MKERTHELISFCNVITTALKSGRPLPETLTVLKAGDFSSPAQQWCQTIGKRLADGYSLEQAVMDLENFDPVLAKLMPLMGENRLIRLLESYTRYLVVVESLNQRLSAAIFYPFMLLMLLNVNLLHLNFFLFPEAMLQLEQLGQRPSVTMYLLYFMEIRLWPWALILPLALLAALFMILRQFVKGIDSGHSLLGRISGMNQIVIRQNAARAHALIGLYLEAGMTLEKALRQSAELSDNNADLLAALAALEQGHPIEAAFVRSELLKSICVAENTPEGLAQTFKRSSDGLFRSTMTRLKNVSTLFGSAAILVAAFFVFSVTSGFFDTYFWLIGSY